MVTRVYDNSPAPALCVQNKDFVALGQPKQLTSLKYWGHSPILPGRCSARSAQRRVA